MTFPLLSLPIQALHLVFRYLKFYELLALSQCFTTLRELIREWLLENPLNCKGVNIFFNGDICGMDLFHNYTYIWQFQSTRVGAGIWSGDEVHDEDDNCEELTPITLKFAPKSLEFKRYLDKGQMLFCHAADQHERLLLDFFEDFIDLFNLPINSLHIHVERVGSMQPIFNCKRLWTCNILNLNTGTIAEHEMTWILNNHQCNEIHTMCHINDTYDFGGTITVDVLDLMEFPLSKRQISDLSSEFIELTDPELGNEDYNVFVKTWMESNDQKLIKLVVWQENDTKGLDQEKILEGIHCYPGREKKNDGSLFESERFVNGLDLIRADGTIATLIVCCDEPLTVLKFVVWHVEDVDEQDEYYGITELFHRMP